MLRLYQATNESAVAGFETETVAGVERVVTAAPIIRRWILGRDYPTAVYLLTTRGWKVEVVNAPK